MKNLLIPEDVVATTSTMCSDFNFLFEKLKNTKEDFLEYLYEIYNTLFEYKQCVDDLIEKYEEENEYTGENRNIQT
jgi:hypothetical protein